MSLVEKRIKFTEMVTRLIRYARSVGYDVILDWALRPRDVQNQMYEQGLSKCDGVTKISQHQRGLAIDLYIIEDDKDFRLVISNDKEKYKKLHEYWSSIGGEEIINWDGGHFEVK